jgi:uncharacterized membrane protein YvlD (DUF360 family)
MGFLTRLVMAALGLRLASKLVPGLHVEGGWSLIVMFGGFTIGSFGSAPLGAAIVSAAGWLASWLVGSRSCADMVVQHPKSEHCGPPTAAHLLASGMLGMAHER